MTAAVLCLKVTLDDVEPKVLRRIEVPADISFDRVIFKDLGLASSFQSRNTCLPWALSFRTRFKVSA